MMDKQLLEKYFQGKCTKEEVDYILSCVGSGKLDDYIAKQIMSFNINYRNEGSEVDQKDELLLKIHDLINMEELVDGLHKNEILSRNEEINDPGQSGKKDIIHFKDRNIDKEAPQKSSWKRFVYLAAATISLIILVLTFADQFNPMNSGDAVETSALIKKETSMGQKLTIHLSDGTIVKLNSGSSISYPQEFEDERIVEIVGEAFFDVAHDPNRPFIVRSSNIETRVLGTSFNFQSFPDADIYNVALVTGKLMVNRITHNQKDEKAENLILNPGEIADLNVHSGHLNKSLFDVEEFTSWKDGIIYFKDADHKKVLQTLENWFGVEIQTVGKPQKEWKFTSKIEKESLKNILEILKASQDIEYKLSGSKVEIIF